MSNRDEYFRRPTSRARFWDKPRDNILGPYDLARPEHGTWIGITKQGRLAILLNFHELNSANHKGLISRGLFPRQFLESSEETHSWIKHVYDTYGDATLKDSGGFTMLCGVLRRSEENPDRIEPFGLLSNRGTHALKLFNSEIVGPSESVVLDGPAAKEAITTTASDIRNDTIGISNSEITAPWPKVHIGVQALEDIIHQAPVSEEKLIEQLKVILTNNTFPMEDASKETNTDGIFYHVRKSIFIPAINVNVADNTDAQDGVYYGTRTNTIILVSKTGHVKYIERTLHEHDTPTEDAPPSDSVFEFDIEGF